MKEQSVKSFEETLNELCAYYMVCGCPCDAFWNGDYTLLKNYVRAHELAVEQRNQELWMQGFYVYEAFDVVLQNAFSKSGTKKAEYPKEPHRITPFSEAEQEEKNRQTVENFRANLMALGRKFSKKHKKGGENG